MKVRFLIDENLSPRLKLALQRLNPAIDVLRVGGPDAPALGTLDPDLLRYLDLAQRLLVTDNLPACQLTWKITGRPVAIFGA